MWQLDEAEGRVLTITKNRDELQAVVSDLEEQVEQPFLTPVQPESVSQGKCMP